MRRFTKKEKFLRILNKDKYYCGDASFTRRLYRKFLTIVRDTGGCNATALFDCNTVRNKLFFINRGFSEAAATSHIQKIQSRGYKFRSKESVDIANIKRKQTFSLKSEQEIEDINRRRGLGYSPEYIASKYNISLEAANKRIQARKEKKANSHRVFLKENGGYKKEWSCRCVEFWLKRGYTEEEARAELKFKFDTRSLESISARLNVDIDTARKIQRDVSEKYRATFNSKTDEEKRDIILRRTKGFKTYSKSSLRFFKKLQSKCDNLDITWLYGESEYFLWDRSGKKNKLFFYDLTLPEINLIIEYNGIIFHPREKDTWATTVEESISKDLLKENLAISNGFKIYYVWDNEDEQLALKRIESIVLKEHDNRKN